MYLSVLNAIALIVLVVAWINYVNLTLSLNIKRNKELAMRKTIGARHLDFIKQFVMESTIVNMLSLSIAITLIQLSKGALTIFFQFHIYTFDSNIYDTVWIVLLVLTLEYWLQVSTRLCRHLKVPHGHCLHDGLADADANERHKRAPDYSIYLLHRVDHWCVCHSAPA